MGFRNSSLNVFLQNGRRGLERYIYPLVFGRSSQLSQNKSFDPSTPSMKKIDNGGGKMGGKRK